MLKSATSSARSTVFICAALCRVQALWSRAFETANGDTRALLQRLVDHEQRGIPQNAGTAGEEAFDLVSTDRHRDCSLFVSR